MLHNCRVHQTPKVEHIIRDYGFTELRYSPYSPDLAPNDFFLFKNVKTDRRGKRFESKLMYAVNNYFADIPRMTS